jgi:hypothetical protein
MSVIKQVARVVMDTTHYTWNHIQLQHYNYIRTRPLQLLCNSNRTMLQLHRQRCVNVVFIHSSKMKSSKNINNKTRDTWQF